MFCLHLPGALAALITPWLLRGAWDQPAYSSTFTELHAPPLRDMLTMTVLPQALRYVGSLTEVGSAGSCWLCLPLLTDPQLPEWGLCEFL